MNRVTLCLISACLLWFLPVIAAAQDEIPGTHEIMELRSDDGRCPEGYRCFIAGSLASYEQMLNRVNGHSDDESRQVTFSQFADANPCRVIFHRADGERRLNGTCSFNQSSEPVTERDFCAGHTCERWIMASAPRHVTIYRVPAVRRLTPSERAEEIVQRMDAVDPVTNTVPAPAEFGAMLTEAAELMDAPQPPSHAQMREVVLSMGRALARTPQAVAATAPAATTPSHAVATETASADEPTPAPAVTDYSRWPWWVTIVACLIGMIVTFFYGRKVGRDQNKPLNELTALHQQHADLNAAHDALQKAFAHRGEVTRRLEGELKSAAGAKRERENSITPAQASEKSLLEFCNSVVKGALNGRDTTEKLTLMIGTIHDKTVGRALQLLLGPALNQFQLAGALTASFPGTELSVDAFRAIANKHSERLERATRTAKEDGRAEGRSEERQVQTRKLDDERTVWQAEKAMLDEERNALAARSGQLSEDLTTAKGKVTDLERQLGEVQVPAQAGGISPDAVNDAYGRMREVTRVIFGEVLWADSTQKRVVSEDKVLSRFSREILVVTCVPSNGNRIKRADLKEETRRELLIGNLLDFLRPLYAELSEASRLLRAALGPTFNQVDLTPLPHSIPLSALPAEAVDRLAATQEGEALALSSLFDHPEEKETSEFSRDDEELPRESTQFGRSPLLAPRSEREDDTKVVIRRDTQRGLGNRQPSVNDTQRGLGNGHSSTTESTEATAEGDVLSPSADKPS
jgi:hypothetical protein